MNNLVITGRLGKDAELKELDGGKKVLNFSVAMDVGFGENKATLWVDCAKWSEKTGVAQYLKKGTQVCVSGEVGLRKWEGGATITLRVDKLDLIGGNRQDDAGNSAPAQQPATANRQPGAPPTIEPLDDLPF